MTYLTIEDILDIRDRLAVGQPERFGIMSTNALMSALAAPRRSAFGVEAYPTLLDKAGALVYSLVQNHPFWDGNKRIASAALRLFCARNGRPLDADDLDMRVFTTGIAKGALRGGVLGKWINDHTENRV
jgi:death on curing protein